MREQLALNLLQIKTQQNNHRRKFDFGNLLENSIEFVRHPHGNTKIVYFVIDPITAAFHSKYWIFSTFCHSSARLGERHTYNFLMQSPSKKPKHVVTKKVHFISFRIVCFCIYSLIYWCLYFFRVFDFKHFSCSPNPF